MIISLTDRLEAAAMGKTALPKLKGKATLTLTDVKTGKRERIVSENMVTDALAKLFAMNYLGMANYNANMAIYNLMGGCFLFNNALTESVNTIWPPNSSDNNLVARCGQTPHSDPTDSRRGNPTAPVITDDHIKFIFDWNQDQGNGTINCVCLTHPLAGDVGLQPNGTASLLKSYSNVNAANAADDKRVNCFRASVLGDNNLTADRLKALPVAFDADGNGISLELNSAQLIESVNAHSFYTANLLENGIMYPYSNYRQISSRTATLSRTFNTAYTYIAQDDSYYYVMERDSGSDTTLYIDVVDKSDMSVTGKTLNITGATLARPAVGTAGAGSYSGVVSGGSVYWVSESDAKTFVRIDINDPADVEELVSTMSSNIGFMQTPININDGLVLGSNYLINGQRVFPVARRAGFSSDDVWFDFMASGNGGPGYFQSGFVGFNYSYDYATQAGFILLPYLATVNNLPAPGVTKDISKTMRLEYVLTQV